MCSVRSLTRPTDRPSRGSAPPSARQAARPPTARTTKVSLEVASRLFEIQGARATTSAYGFDRHWRNLRTHTVHDPVAYKAREIGDWTLNRTAPAFTLYS